MPRGTRRRGLSRRQVISSTLVAVAGVGALGTGVVLQFPEAAGVTSSSVQDAPSPTPSPTPDYFAEAQTRIEAYVTQTNARVAISVRDLSTTTDLTIGSRAFQTASIVKVDILAALMLRLQDQGRQITAADRERARKMIVISDNDSATALFNKIGGVSGLNAANKKLGLTQTKADVHWGMTSTTSGDQIKLLSDISGTDGPLTPTSRELILDLMGQVDSTQRWGVPAAASTATTDVFVKNGWVPDDANKGRWQVNSIGRLVEPGHDWLIAVLSDDHVKQADGIKLIEQVVKYTMGELRTLPVVTAP
ncbi:serine hydrolase [Micromonospora sp. NPDC050397]|uniref:serine hydrolase n=1 Tax=Micromonospora sp. NPDC050397 TaxID=3364279 RepID=UPI00384EE3EF